jgi:SNF2 family DNA or RNA helicase
MEEAGIIESYSDLVKDSGKMAYLDKILESLIDKGHKTLIFS